MELDIREEFETLLRAVGNRIQELRKQRCGESQEALAHAVALKQRCWRESRLELWISTFQ